MTAELDVAVVGAGPYGLAAAAHLAHLRVAVFGQPMRTWREMLPDMQLRASWEEMELTAPGGAGRLADWLAEAGRSRPAAMCVHDFVAYADWFRRTFVPHVVESEVTAIDDAGDVLEIEDAAGGRHRARRLVLAVGVMPFAHVPEPFAAGLDERVELAAGCTDYARLSGATVAVVGSGQTAVETAARALRAGAEVEILSRSRLVWFADREPGRPRSPLRGWLHRQAYPVVGYGPPLLNRLVLHPGFFSRVPPPLRRRITRRLLRAGGSPWLRDQVEGKARVSEGVTVTSLGEAASGRLVLRLDDGTARRVDRVLLATGYRFRLDRLSYLSRGLRERIEVVDGWPRLDRGFRSSHPRVYFIGYPAEGLYGACARFVLGVPFTARQLARSIPAAAPPGR